LHWSQKSQILQKSQIQHSVLQQVLIIKIDISGINIVELEVVEIHFELSLQLISGILSRYSPSNSSRSFFWGGKLLENQCWKSPIL